MAKQIHIRLDDSLFETLSEYADASGQSVQDIISSSIPHGKKNKKKMACHELF